VRARFSTKSAAIDKLSLSRLQAEPIFEILEMMSGPMRVRLDQLPRSDSRAKLNYPHAGFDASEDVGANVPARHEFIISLLLDRSEQTFHHEWI
jgi:hypothetical protein